MKTPCEVSMWYVVPYIRSRVAQSIVNDLGLKQAFAARKLGVTDAAVSQYLSGKRAKSDLGEEWLELEIKAAANKIVETDDEVAITMEICRVCKMVQDSKLIDKLVEGACNRCP